MVPPTPSEPVASFRHVIPRSTTFAHDSALPLRRIRSLERRQALFEKAFATLGVDLEALLGSENTEKLDAIGDASSRAVSPPEQFGQRVAGESFD